jgi:DNA-directed RNA polymerase subunit beta'
MTEDYETMYDAVTAAFGLGDPITPEGKANRLKGAIRQVIGTSPKSGLFQSKVISKNVGGVGRGVVTPNPNLDMDSIGIPKDSAWTLYKDFVMRRLVRRGVSPLRAVQMIDDRNPAAANALEEEMKTRPVMVNRAPVWHKFNLMAFYPHIVDGSTIQVSPLITKGFTMDFDGDQANFHVPISDKAVEQATAKMLPSRNLTSLTDLRSIRHSPSMEMTMGLYWLTQQAKKGQPVEFPTMKAAKEAYEAGQIEVNTPIAITGA